MQKYKHFISLTIILLVATLLITASSFTTVAKDQTLFTLHLLVNPSSTNNFKIAQILQNEFSKLGIELKLETMETSTINDIMYSPKYGDESFENKGWDLNIGLYWWWPKDYVWFKGCYHTSGIPPQGWNTWGWKNGLADLHLDKGLSTYDKESRAKHLKKWQEVFHEDPPHANIYWPETPQITASALKGVNAFLWTHNIYQWHWSDDREDTTVTYAVQEKLRNLNPLFLNGSYYWVEPMYDPLYKIFYNSETGEYEYVPTMAKSLPKISEDGLDVTIPIRKGVTWHDGEPLTAEDVKFTYDTILNTETGASAHGDMSGVISEVTVEDKYTIKLKLKKPTPYLTSLLASGSASIIPEHVLGDVPPSELRKHSTNVDKPAPGTGPYKFVSWKKGQSMELAANKNYCKGVPPVERVLIRIIPEPSTALMAFERGEVQALSPYIGQSISGEMDRLRKKSDVQVEVFISGAVKFLAFNTDHPILNNRYVRRALSYAIPRKHIAENILHGFAKPANSPVPPFWFAYNDELPKPEYSLEKAKELLEKAGYDVPDLG